MEPIAPSLLQALLRFQSCICRIKSSGLQKRASHLCTCFVCRLLSSFLRETWGQLPAPNGAGEQSQHYYRIPTTPREHRRAPLAPDCIQHPCLIFIGTAQLVGLRVEASQSHPPHTAKRRSLSVKMPPSPQKRTRFIQKQQPTLRHVAPMDLSLIHISEPTRPY